MVEDVIVKVVIVIALSLILTYLTTAAHRAKPTIDAATGARIFGYGRGWKTMALISLVVPVFMGAVALSLYRGGESDYPVFISIALIFTAASSYLLLECFASRLIVTEEGITRIWPWSGKRTFRWDQIESIRYSKGLRWYVIIGPDRKKVYVSEFLNGFSVLTVEFRNRIPRERWKDTGGH